LTLQSLDAPKIQQLNLSSQELATSKPQFELIQVSHVSNKLITKHALEIKSIMDISKIVYNVLGRWQFHYHLGCKRLHAQVWKLGYCEIDSTKFFKLECSGELKEGDKIIKVEFLGSIACVLS
jgi:hypothetical protein